MEVRSESEMDKMPRIIKIKHKSVSTNHMRIPNRVFEEGLIFDAIGLYNFLLCRKQTEFSVEDVNNRSSDTPEHNLEILSELEKHHLIINTQANFTWKLCPIEQV